jgi:hypothetical protein
MLDGRTGSARPACRSPKVSYGTLRTLCGSRVPIGLSPVSDHQAVTSNV